MKIAFAAIVKGTDAEAELLGRCLSYVAPYVDKLFITITHKPGEEINQKCLDICDFYDAQVSNFEWVNDFAKARNYNFSQVPQEFDYILWCDADDAFRGLNKLRDTIEAHPADAYSMFYMYSFDSEKNPTTVHHKTRLVKNDGCVRWAGKLHEDFAENRQLVTYHIDGIEVLHLSTEDRFNSAKERNLEIAKQAVDELPDDPRVYYNYGTTLYACSKFDEAIAAFDTFLKTSHSEDEKYIVRLRRAETFWAMGNPEKAIEEAQYAIGIKPEFPDAYFTLGTMYAETKKLRKAAELFISGLVKPRPYYQIIVYNPRDYDYVPMMKLANIYFQLSRPDLALPLLKGCAKIYPNDKNLKNTIKQVGKEVKKFDDIVVLIKKLSEIKDDNTLRTELDKIPDDFKSHPAVCNLRNVRLVKSTSSGKDLIIYCGFTEEEWTPNTIREKGIGGSEEAVFHLSTRLANNGWNVTVYNNCGYKVQTFGNVTYKPFWMWNYRDKQDAVILWRTPIYADYEINSPKIYIDLHDVIPAGEFTEKRLQRITKVFVKSHFHRKLFPKIPDNQIVVIPNGIVPEVFDQHFDRNSKLVINTSAPDRSLTALIKIWPKVKAQVPDAVLKWAYGWGVYDVAHADDTKMLDWKVQIQKQLKEAGIEELGRVNHQEVARMYMTANIWLYPTGFAEIDCISATKAMAGGAIPVATDFAALGEKTGFGYFIHSHLTADTWSEGHDFSSKNETELEAMTKKVIELLQNPPPEERRNAMRMWAKEKYSWESVTNQWLSIIN